jgi:2-polyprenyl-3-methyl-5-hydroxy-6-metoxy-1,4-benzoquinol methylase
MTRDLAGQAHWDKRTGIAKPRSPSKLNSTVGDLTALLEPHVKPGSRVLEVGCAPGKFLLWCALEKSANVCGVEYAENSHKMTSRLFADADVIADIRKEDFMQTTFEPRTFDVIYSFGVVEHFDDPQPMVQKHFDMLKPSGTAIITLPNFGGGYGWLAKHMDRENYEQHNITIMSESGLLALAPEAAKARSYSFGRVSAWQLPWGNFPRSIERLACYGINAAALLQPVQIKLLCPWLVLEMERA